MAMRFCVRALVIILVIVLAIAIAWIQPEQAGMLALGVVLWFAEVVALSFLPLR